MCHIIHWKCSSSSSSSSSSISISISIWSTRSNSSSKSSSSSSSSSIWSTRSNSSSKSSSSSNNCCRSGCRQAELLYLRKRLQKCQQAKGPSPSCLEPHLLLHLPLHSNIPHSQVVLTCCSDASSLWCPCMYIHACTRKLFTIQLCHITCASAERCTHCKHGQRLLSMVSCNMHTLQARAGTALHGIL